MSFKIEGTTITLTRGDTLPVVVTIMCADGRPYIPVEGDSVRFAMKERYTDRVPLLTKDIPIDTLLLVLEPDDTTNLDFGTYVYDIQLTKADGTVDTFIAKAKIKITEEVD